MKSSPAAPRYPNVERDYRVFFWFMTLIIAGMYIWCVSSTPELRQPLRLILFTVLINIHIVLHWFVGYVQNRRWWAIAYVLAQGGMAFVITYLSGTIGMVFALYMALIGEGIGLFGMKLSGLLASGFYLALSLINFIIFTTPAGYIWWLLGTLPTVLFVSLYVTLYNRQADANLRARALLADLETANRQLTEYAARVEDLTIANERQRMARELHDTLSQGLAGLILQLEAADAHLANARLERARGIVQQAMERARATLAEARQAIGDLRAGQLGSANLEESLRREIAHFTETAGIPCDLAITLSSEIPEPQCETVMRAVAETLTNIARHAQAAQASVRLSTDDDSLTVEIYDNGVGFDPDDIPSGHFGLLGLRERVRLAGGKLEIASQPTNGTTVRLKLPLSTMDVES